MPAKLLVLVFLALAACKTSPSSDKHGESQAITGSDTVMDGVIEGRLDLPASLQDRGAVEMDVFIYGFPALTAKSKPGETFVIRGIPRGKRRVVALSRDRKIGALSDEWDVRGGLGLFEPSLVLQLEETGSIAGQVSAEGALAVTRAEVSLLGTPLAVETQPDGMFLIGGVPPGAWTIMAKSADFQISYLHDVKVAASATTTAPQFVLMPLSGFGASMILNGGAPSAQSRSVVVAFKPFGQPARYMLSTFADFRDGIWKPFTLSTEAVFDSDGVKRLYAKFSDARGAESPVVMAQIEIDSRARPTLAIDRCSPYCNRQKVKLYLGTVRATHVACNENKDALEGMPWVPYLNSYEHAFSAGDGEKILYCKLKNEADALVEYVTLKTILDTTPPAAPQLASMGGRQNTNTASLLLTSSATDAYFEKHQIKGGAYADWTDVPAFPLTVSLPLVNKLNVFEIRGVDKAGNVGASVKAGYFYGYKTVLDDAVLGFFTGADQRVVLPASYTPWDIKTSVGKGLSLAAGSQATLAAGIRLDGSVTLEAGAKLGAAGASYIGKGMQADELHLLAGSQLDGPITVNVKAFQRDENVTISQSVTFIGEGAP